MGGMWGSLTFLDAMHPPARRGPRYLNLVLTIVCLQNLRSVFLWCKIRCMCTAQQTGGLIYTVEIEEFESPVSPGIPSQPRYIRVDRRPTGSVRLSGLLGGGSP